MEGLTKRFGSLGAVDNTHRCIALKGLLRIFQVPKLFLAFPNPERENFFDGHEIHPLCSPIKSNGPGQEERCFRVLTWLSLAVA